MDRAERSSGHSRITASRSRIGDGGATAACS
jgi:hypothetical protein